MGELESLIADLQTRWQLLDWRVELRRCTQDNVPTFGYANGLASISVDHYNRTATIHIANDYRPRPNETVASEQFVVAHEMAHLLLWDAMRTAQDALEWCQPNVERMLSNLLIEREEIVCNALAADAVGERPEHYREGEEV